MTIREALQIAIDAMAGEIKRLGQQANLYDIYGLESCRRESVRRRKLREAIEVLREGLTKMVV